MLSETKAGGRCVTCGYRSREHDSLHLVRHGNPVHIDVQMVELIQACWEAGIETTESCEGFWEDQRDDEDVFISFDHVSDYVLFAESILRGGPRDAFGDDVALNWDWSCHPIEWDATKDEPTVVPGMFCSVVFPLSDVPEAVVRLRRGSELA